MSPKKSTPTDARPRAAAGEARVTLNFLAERLELSPASISIVLNDAPAAEAIPQHTKDRIHAAAREFGYRPHSIARSLARQRTFTIGVLIPDVSEGYVAGALSGVEDYLLQAGYLYFLASHRHRTDLIEEYKRLLVDRAVEGVIALDTPFPDPMPVPVVAISGHNETEGVTNIELNHERAAELALEHLVALGHHQIAVIQGPAYTADADVRWRSIEAIARRLGCPIDPRLVVRLTRYDLSPGPGCEAAHELLASEQPFTAIFAFNDVTAIGAMLALDEAGLTVPEQVAVIGFDDIPGAIYHRPALTTVRQPLRRMGETAAQLLLERLEHPTAKYATRVMVEPELVVRGTTGPHVEEVAVRGQRLVRGR